MEYPNRNCICRLCLCCNGNYVDIFQAECQGLIVAATIVDLLQLKVAEKDGYSKVICLTCLRKLNEFGDFKKQCWESVITYDNIIKSPKNLVDHHQEEVVNAVFIKIEPNSEGEEENLQEEYCPGSNLYESTQVSAFPSKDLDKGNDFKIAEKPTDSISADATNYETVNATSTKEDKEVIKNEVFPCLKCGKKFFDISHLNQHSNSHDRGGEFCCEICSVYFSDKSLLEEHLRTHSNGGSSETSSENKVFTCYKCAATRDTRDEILTHMKTHGAHSIHVCNICHKTYIKKAYLRTHLVQHTGNKPFRCSVCSKSYMRSQTLKVHERIHSGVRPFECSICSRGFRSQGDLRKHGRIHMGERPHQCEICYKTFTNSNHLTVHKRKHNGEKPFECPTCSKCFEHANALVIHQRFHTGERPFECKDCSKRFACTSHLIRHQKSHNGQRPYQCLVCLKHFSDQSVLVKHQRTLHNPEVYTVRS